MSNFISSNAFRIVEGRPVTSSRTVAEYFCKKHSDVVRSIQTIINQKPNLQASRNFAQWSEEVEIGSGAKRTVTGFWMDRKGFSILAMGFTGAKALDFKCAFYDEFERMEKQLQSPTNDTLTIEHQYAIRREVSKRAKKTAEHYQTVYRALNNHFKVPRYTCILDKDFDAAISFIQSVNLNVPDEETKSAPKESTSKTTLLVDKRFVNTILTILYEIRYHQRDNFQKLIELLYEMNSPLAEDITRAVEDPMLALAESQLRKLGFDLYEMPCYKNWAKANA